MKVRLSTGVDGLVYLSTDRQTSIGAENFRLGRESAHLCVGQIKAMGKECPPVRPPSTNIEYRKMKA